MYENPPKIILNRKKIAHRILGFRVKSLPEISLKVVERNGFYAHSESVLIAVFSDKLSKCLLELMVNKTQSLRGNRPSVSFIAYSNKSDSNAYSDVQLSIRQFVLLKLNFKAWFGLI